MKQLNADLRCAQCEGCSAESSKRIQSIFTGWLTCAYFSESFYTCCCFDPPFFWDTRGNLLWEGEKEKEDVWAPPGALLHSGRLKRNAREHVYTRVRKRKLSVLFPFKGPTSTQMGRTLQIKISRLWPWIASVCPFAGVDRAFLANAISVQSWKRDPCIVRGARLQSKI